MQYAELGCGTLILAAAGSACGGKKIAHRRHMGIELLGNRRFRWAGGDLHCRVNYRRLAAADKRTPLVQNDDIVA